MFWRRKGNGNIEIITVAMEGLVHVSGHYLLHEFHILKTGSIFASQLTPQPRDCPHFHLTDGEYYLISGHHIGHRNQCVSHRAEGENQVERRGRVAVGAHQSYLAYKVDTG